MKNILLFILFLVCTLSVFAQDTCRLTFAESADNLYSAHHDQLKNFVGNKNVLTANLTYTIPTEGSVSKNRVAAELHLQNIKRILENMGISNNRILSNFTIASTKTASPKMNVAFTFARAKGERVLRKTSVVEVSYVGLIPQSDEGARKKNKNPKEEEQLLKISDFKKNEKINLPSLLFESATHFFVPGSDKVLEELAAILIAKPNLKVELQGHICCRVGGTDAMDPVSGKFNLSEMRAKAVYLFLISRGVDPDRMSYKGFASTRKLYPKERNQTEMLLNRRVEVLVVED